MQDYSESIDTTLFLSGLENEDNQDLFLTGYGSNWARASVPKVLSIFEGHLDGFNLPEVQQLGTATVFPASIIPTSFEAESIQSSRIVAENFRQRDADSNGSLEGDDILQGRQTSRIASDSISGYSIAIRTEGTISSNGNGDFDGDPLIPSDDALIYAAKGFTFNGNYILPVKRDAAGNPIKDASNRPILVDNAVTVAAGYTTINASNNPYSNLLPPQVVPAQTVVVPTYADVKSQELATRIPTGSTVFTFNAQQNPINNVSDWNSKFPSPGTAGNPKVVRVTPGGLNIPNGVNLSNYVITVESGDINFNGNSQVLDNVVLVTNSGNINLSNVQSTNLSVLSSGAINMNSQARFGGKTLIANGSGGTTFNGATKTANANATATDSLRVISQGNITYNGASNTRGDFLSVGTFTFNGNSSLFGSIGAKQNIIFNSGATVFGVSPTIADTTPPVITGNLQRDTAPNSTTNIDRITSDPSVVGTVTDTSQVTEFKAGFDSKPVTQYVSLLADLVNGNFSLNRTRINQIAGGTLTDGLHTLHLQAKDQFGNTSALYDIIFTLDTTPPVTTFDLDVTSDTPPIGDRSTTASIVTLKGQTEANAKITLQPGNITLSTGTTGGFALPDIALAVGVNPFTINAVDLAGNSSSASNSFTRLAGIVEEVLTEGNSFQVELDKTFQNLTQPSILSFTYNPSFDTTDRKGINDAFEVAVVDEAGKSLVQTISPNRTTFFNFTEGETPVLGADAQLSGNTVTVTLPVLPAGKAAKVIFQLVNNDLDTQTRFGISNIKVQTGGTGLVTPISPPPANPPATSIDFSRLTDVTPSLVAEYDLTSFNTDSRVLYAKLDLRNQGQYAVKDKLLVVLDNISDPTVTPLNADGTTPSGQAYYDFSNLVTGKVLSPGQISQSSFLAFANPSSKQFTYNLRFLSSLNGAPVITSTPTIEALLGNPYIYNVRATDPENDVLSFKLVAAPQGMSIDPNTGVLTWTPTSSNLGNQSITVQVKDIYGATAEQAFTLLVRDSSSTPNRPPIFTSTPIVETGIGQQYVYQAKATDPDFNPISFSLVSGPTGMTIDAQTGLVTWTPANQLIGTQDVSLRVSDGNGGIAEQNFKLAVQSITGNNSPFITSEPVTSAYLQGGYYNGYSYQVKAIDPDGDNLTYSLVNPPNKMTIDAKTGRLSWPYLQANQVGNYNITVQVQDGKGGADVQNYSLNVANSVPGQIYGSVFSDLDGNGIRGRTGTGAQGTPIGSFTEEQLRVIFAGNDNRDVRTDYLYYPFVTNSPTDLTPDTSGNSPYKLYWLDTANLNLAYGGYPNTGSINPTFGQNIAFKPNDPNTIIIKVVNNGFYAGISLNIYEAKVKRGLGDHIVDFEPPILVNTLSYPQGTAMAYSPDGVLFIQASANHIYPYQGEGATDPIMYEFKPGSITPDKVVNFRAAVDSLAIKTRTFWTNNIPVSFRFVPPDVSGQGQLKAFTYAGLTTINLTPDGSGTYNIDSITPENIMTGSYPEEFDYVLPGSPGIEEPRMALFNSRALQLISLDGNGNPIIFYLDGYGGTNLNRPFAKESFSLVRNDRTYGLMVADPVTGDLMWSTDRGALSNGHGILPQYSDFPAYEFLMQLRGFTPPKATDPGLEDWRVYLDRNNNNQFDANEPFTLTDKYGAYKFTLDPGSYKVAIEPKAGWTLKNPTDGYQVAVTSGRAIGDQFFAVTKGTTTNANNNPPAFVSTPTTRIGAGGKYNYPSLVREIDGDPLSFDLLVKPSGMVVTEDGDVLWRPTRAQAGKNDVTLRVQDGRGGVDIQTFQVEVTIPNTPPAFSEFPPITTIAVNQPFQYQFKAQDAENDPITFALVSPPVGATIDPITGLFNWTPSNFGLQTITVTAEDNRGGKNTKTMQLQVGSNGVNNPPIFTSSPRTSIAIGQIYSYEPQVQDPDNDPLLYTLQTPFGLNNFLIDSKTGRVSGQPLASQVGAYPLAITANDGRGGITTQNFTLDIVTTRSNSAPQITSTPKLFATPGKQYQYQTQAIDPDNDPIRWSLDKAPSGMSIDPISGNILWTPTADQTGKFNVTVTVQDLLGKSTTQAFELTVSTVGGALSIGSTPPTQAGINKPYLYLVQANSSTGDTLSYALIQQPPGMTINPQTGLIRWTPTSLALGDVKVEVSDSQGNKATQAYQIVVGTDAINLPPAITSLPVVAAELGKLYQYQVIAIDPEAQPLTFSIQNPSAIPGLSINSTSGLLSWTPSLSQAGTYTIAITATDPTGGIGTQTFNLNVAANNPPVIGSQPVLSAIAGNPYRYDVQASDPNNDAITYSLDPASITRGMSIDTQGRIAWNTKLTDTGIYPVTLTVRDNRGASVVQQYNLNVSSDIEAPKVVINRSTAIIDKGETISFQVNATDNIAVTSLSLVVNGVAVVLDANGVATVKQDIAGTFSAVATAKDAAGNTSTASASYTVLGGADPNAPVVVLNLDDDATFTAPTVLKGSVTDNNLSYYTISVAPIGGTIFKEIFRGTSTVANGDLGKFDPSLLNNDAYTLKVEAIDLSGNISSTERTVNVTGDLKLGNFKLSFTDLSIPVTGIPINVTRTYDSLTSNTKDEFGYGWRLEFRDTDLRTSLGKDEVFEQLGIRTQAFKQGSKVFITLPGGKREAFTFKPTKDFLSGTFPPVGGFDTAIYHPAFVGDKGVTSTLTVKDTRLSNVDGKYFVLGSGVPYNPADDLLGKTYKLTTKEGIVYEIDATTGDLLTVSNPNGNTLTYTDAAITSDTGQKVTFERDPQGRIVSVADPSGQKVKYAYDAKGDLVGVTDRENNTTQFEYDVALPHYLDKIVDPLGRTGIRNEYDANGRLVKMVDALGKPVELAYDLNNSTETVKDALGNPTTYEYDVRGNIVTEIDALAGITRRSYDSENNLLSETDPEGRTKSYSYDALNNKLSETDGLGNVTRYTYGNYSRVNTETDPLGNTTTNSYDSKGNLDTRRDALGNTTYFVYDLRGQLRSVTDAIGSTSAFSYDSFGRISSATDALGNITSYIYDASGNQLSQTQQVTIAGVLTNLVTTNTYDKENRLISTTDPEGRTSRTEYDKNGRAIANYDALNRKTEHRYDDKGQKIETLYPDGTSEKTIYDDAGRQIAMVDRAGRRTEMRYDPLGRNTETISPDNTPSDLTDNPRTKTEFDKAGQVLAQIDERGNRSTFSYDNAGRQREITDALNFKTIFGYDNAGRRVSVTDALNRTTRSEYDALGRNTKTIFADGTFSTTNYDRLGRKSAMTDQMGYRTGYEYDPLNRLTGVVDALNQRTSYGYDQLGRMIAQTDANNHTTSFEYDKVGQRTGKVLPLGQRYSYGYDPNGNLKTQTDPNGKTATMTYDVNNRLTRESYQDGTVISYSYTPIGQRQTVTDARGVTTYDYDVRDRLIRKADPDGKEIRYEYDLAGNKTAVIIPSGRTNYTFDALNRLDTVTNGTDVTDYNYDSVGNLVQTTLPNGVVESRAYDSLNRLINLQTKKGADVLTGFTYALDDAGMRKSVTEAGGRKVDYAYDKLYRLTEERVTDVVTGNSTTSYVMDAVGNRLSKTDSITGATTYVYDANDRLLTETNGGQAKTYTYDAKGNTLSEGKSVNDKTDYTWDDKGRLLKAVIITPTGTKTLEYQYNENNIRVSQKVDGVETRFLVDPNRDYAQVLEEYNPINGTVIASYVYGLDLISQNRGGAKSFYLYDGLGSVRALTDASGAVTDRYNYDAYGNSLSSTGSTANSYRYAGEQFDPNLKDYYLRDRYYGSDIGRFTRADTFEGKASNPSSLNDYLYANANPNKFTDPTGKFSMAEFSAAERIRLDLSKDYLQEGLGIASQIAKIGGREDLETIANLAIIGSDIFSMIKSVNFSNILEKVKVPSPIPRGGRIEGVESNIIGEGFGLLEGKSFKTSQRSYDIVESHVKSFGYDKPNEMMLQRIKSQVQAGRPLSGADAVFFTHELTEANFIAKGFKYEDAHPLSIEKYQISPFSIYHPDVIIANPDKFSRGYKKFWGVL